MRAVRRARLCWARRAAVALCALLLAGVFGVRFASSAQQVATDTCGAGQICTVTIGGTTYVVEGPCDTSTLGSPVNGCLIISSGPAGPPLTVCGLHGCGPTQIVQMLGLPASFEGSAEQGIAGLRGVANDQLNTYWSRDEIRADMYLHVLGMANSAAGSLSSAEQTTVTFYTNLINQQRKALAQNALNLYNTWAANPCGFHVPVGDPNAYLEQSDVGGGPAAPCNIPPNSPACALGACTPNPPSADQFTAWTEGAQLKTMIQQWGEGLQEEGGVSLTDPQAEQAASFEYDAALGGMAEGIGYLTARHSSLANLPSSAETTAESDVQQAWLDGLGDLAGDQFRDVMVNAVTTPFEAFDGAVTDGFASALEDGLAAALEEDAAGIIAESFETVVGPAIAAVAVIAFESYQQAVNADVPTKLQDAVNDANNNYDLAHYASSAEGRALILDALVQSTMPDFTATRLADPTFGQAPAAGPAVPSDPQFQLKSGCTTTPSLSPSFSVTDWGMNTASTSVRNGWFVQRHNNGAFRYTSHIDYLSGGGTTQPTATGCTITNAPADEWRAWLDGSNFLAQRVAVGAGNGTVVDEVNADCGGLPIGLPLGNTDFGDDCVNAAGQSFGFPVKSGDVVQIGGQVRTVGAVTTNSDGNVTTFTTSEPFDTDPATNRLPTNAPVLVLTQPDGNCLTESSLGSRVSGPDCVLSPTLQLEQGATATLTNPPLVITASSPSVTYGASAPTITPSYSGFVNGDTSASLTTPPTCTTTYTTGSKTGTYQTSCSGAVDPNYTISYQTGVLNVGPAPLTISASSGSMTYGGTVPAITPAYSGLAGGDQAPATAPACSTAATSSSPVGGYQTSCSGAADPNYTISYQNGSVSVGPAPLTVTADNQHRLFGGTNPPLTATISGFVNAETLASSGVTGAPACTTTATQSSAGGTYPINCTLGTLGASNYTFASFEAGTLTVTFSSSNGGCLTGTVSGPLDVAAGQATCAGPGAQLNGPVTVEAGSSLDIEGASVSGPIRVSGGGVVRICGATVSGQVSIQDSTGLVLVGGDTATDPCAANTINGPVTLTDNTGGVEVNGNTINGPLKISNTSGPLPAPDTGSVHAAGNNVSGHTTITP